MSNESKSCNEAVSTIKVEMTLPAPPEGYVYRGFLPRCETRSGDLILLFEEEDENSVSKWVLRDTVCRSWVPYHVAKPSPWTRVGIGSRVIHRNEGTEYIIASPGDGMVAAISLNDGFPGLPYLDAVKRTSKVPGFLTDDDLTAILGEDYRYVFEAPLTG
jgi:hypothetical protein